MPDQAAALAIVASPASIADAPGPAFEAGSGARVIPLDTRRRRPSPKAVAASRANHPAQLWADARARASLDPSVVAIPS